MTTRVGVGRAPRHRLRAARRGPGWRTPLLRELAVFALTLLPFAGVLADIVVSIAHGSPLTYLVAVPVLIGVIAVGYHSPPAGVGDAESDWILAALFGGLGLFLRHLMANRFPTLSGLWELPMVGAVLWAACITAVLFGVRRVIQLWALWLFALATVTPLPFLLATAALGGGAVAAGAVSAALGGVAVFLAGRCSRPAPRALVAVLTAVVSFGVAAVAATAGPGAGEQLGIVAVLLAGGLIPAAGFAALTRCGRRQTCGLNEMRLPRRSPAALLALIAGAGVVFVLNIPYSRNPPVPLRADPQWVSALNLPAAESFPFIRRYLGPDATFVRHRLPATPGTPEAAVDVITSDNLAALLTYRDAIWYPATVPPNYRSFDLGPAVPGGRVAATDSALATDSSDRDWYVVTWLWQVGSRFQQIFVVVNQTWTSQEAPPAPAGLSLRATVIGPALWLVRQQADPSTRVEPAVSGRGSAIAEEIIRAGRPRRD